MKISHIKLSGFKSFVDPTTLKLPAELTCIVGPNGCGKSNIIDAINWVMGETSAKHLRGESMADVIFNGSNTRKPVGQASVEIVFDNADGTIGGQYAGYNEISIKRQVNRDGSSAYFLNAVRCRRKDITNVFLGTGLGARGYSVIEQGMISRVIEAKPEELRGFLEEAAGISKYKERRRETENRIRHTVDNLDRVNDIRAELEKQLTHLERQARAAEKYNELKAEERTAEAELAALTCRALATEVETLSATIGERTTAIEGQLAELRSAEAEVADLTETRDAAANRVSETQRAFYEVTSEIDRAEQALKFRRERASTLAEDLERVGGEIEELESLRTRDASFLASAREELTTKRPALEAAHAKLMGCRTRVSDAEAALKDWQGQWDALNQERSEAVRSRERASARHEHLGQSLARLDARRDDLVAERNAVDVSDAEARAFSLTHLVEALEGGRDGIRADLEALQSELARAREAAREVATEVEGKRGELHAEQIRLASMEALQDALLGVDSKSWVSWLEAQGLKDVPRVFESLRIEKGWERAVERVARVRVDAFAVDPDEARALVDLSPEQRVAFVFGRDDGRSRARDIGLPPVASLVAGEAPVDVLFGGAYAATTRAEAIAHVDALEPGEVILTRDGSLFGAGWFEIDADGEQPAESVLSRAAEIEELASALEAAEADLAALKTRQRDADGRIRMLEDQIARAGRERDAVGERLAGARERLNRAAGERQQAQTRLEQIDRELQKIEADRTERSREIAELEATLGEAGAEVDRLDERLAALRLLQAERVTAVDEAREALREAQEAAHALELESERLSARESSLNEALASYEARGRSLAERHAKLGEESEENAAPIPELEAGLNAAIARRGEVDEALNRARNELASVDERVRETDKGRQALERAINEAREALGEIQLEHRSVATRLEDARERLAALGHDLDEILGRLEPDADVGQWEERLAGVQRRISRLGPINMAAIDEFQQLEERKTYLDAQHEDLSGALEALREAIETIDRETRTRFKETYEKVNGTLKEMFPKLFGGGHAYLELTGDDLLETGVTVMARPPGKRNSTIHLLSGGEKALTAIAFVFSIFELAPAPFCLLDEVDAPLDDNNVIRLTEMLKEMSSRVQFAIVTHNKITMEIGQQLIGVTMNEPGVSRLVSVSMDEAVELAQSA